MKNNGSINPTFVAGIPEIHTAGVRAAMGKAARENVPREAHAELPLGSARDPSSLLLAQDESRVPELVPIRHARMAVSPFTFFRGAAVVMAADLAATPTVGLRVQVCGDAHLSNFGAYASPERRLVFDVNDFDETTPGPFEWDVKRLAASFVVAGRSNGFTPRQSRSAALTTVKSYRTAMRSFAHQPMLAVWYAHLDLEEVVEEYASTLRSNERKRRRDLEAAEAALAKAHARDSLQALKKLTTQRDGRRRIVSDPPLIVPLDEMTGQDFDTMYARLSDVLADYRETLSPDRRQLLQNFTLTDVAHKVVGVGSVGMRAWVFLLEGAHEDDVLLLQAKQAGPSALAGFVEGTDEGNHGARVVQGQRLIQATSDILLGWLSVKSSDSREDDYYLRQLKDWKLSAIIDEMRPSSMNVYAKLCGWTLARAHARSGDRFAIAGYLGKSTEFDEAIADFAEAYADQNERDHAAFAAAVTEA